MRSLLAQSLTWRERTHRLQENRHRLVDFSSLTRGKRGASGLKAVRAHEGEAFRPAGNGALTTARKGEAIMTTPQKHADRPALDQKMADGIHQLLARRPTRVIETGRRT